MKTIKLIILVSLLSACTQKAATVKKYYRLELNPVSVSTDKIDEQLWINRPDAHSILGNRPFVATDETQALQQLSHHAWIESPKLLVQELLQQHFQKSWVTVLTERPTSDDYFQLHSRILAFEKHHNTANIKIAFSFYSPDRELIKQMVLSSTQSFTGSEYAQFVQAMSMAINDVFSQLELKP